MSWDLSVFASADVPPPVEEMPRDWRGQVLGTPDQVRAALSLSFPGVDWASPNWGHFEGPGFSLEFNIGDDDPNDGFMIHVRGGGDPVTPMLRLAEASGWFILDCSSGEWLHHAEEPDAGWLGFQAYRDRVLSR
jgi:hypothetical protein